MIRRILLAVDTENDSLQAEALATQLAKSSEAEVTVLHVREWLLGPAGPFDEGWRHAAYVTRRVAERLRAKGIRVQQQTRSTYAPHTAREIVEAAREQEADLIVLAPRRSASLIRTMLGGDVTTGILRNATVPVLIMPSGPRRTMSRPTGHAGQMLGRARLAGR